MRRDPASLDCGGDRAAGLQIVTAIAKAAMPEKRAQVDEGFSDSFGVEVGEAECLHTRRVDDPTVIVGEAI